MNFYAVSFGIPQARGGVRIVEQSIVVADSYDKAWTIGNRRCKRGEEVYDIVCMKTDKDLLDYTNSEVI